MSFLSRRLDTIRIIGVHHNEQQKTDIMTFLEHFERALALGSGSNNEKGEWFQTLKSMGICNKGHRTWSLRNVSGDKYEHNEEIEQIFLDGSTQRHDREDLNLVCTPGIKIFFKF